MSVHINKKILSRRAIADAAVVGSAASSLCKAGFFMSQKCIVCLCNIMIIIIHFFYVSVCWMFEACALCLVPFAYVWLCASVCESERESIFVFSLYSVYI